MDTEGMDNESLLLKRNQLISASENYSKSMGDRVYYVKYFDENQNEVKCPLKDQAGRTIMPDTEDGKYRKVNGVWYNAELEAIKAFEETGKDPPTGHTAAHTHR